MRIIWIYLNLIFWTLLFGLSSFFAILLTGKKENFKFFGVIWGKTLSFIFNIKLKVKGKHNLQDRNYIFASNHASLIDIPLLLIAVNRYTVFIAKSELSKIPIFKSILDRAGFIFVDRKNNDSAVKSMNNLMEDIKKIPRSVAIFPEGTRTSDGNLLPFKKGAAIFAINTDIPVVPVAISGTYSWSKKKLFDISQSVISFEFGEPIITENYSFNDRDYLTEKIKTNIKNMKID
ncbi:1-acyl-sn-glycerol-3-phosphate acyltransferase [Candidatus Marinimicrobia bacterium]|nr:1-acyl-sn-glycerol-3-phosphate acyltransferase [Candidatus Neomarinimicrobiota bacterium]MDA9735910.1 1-acyl-sn-glycerol-3-phosphate acyltransferase [Candidatus Neomarinimicrobiota bacterium]